MSLVHDVSLTALLGRLHAEQMLRLCLRKCKLTRQQCRQGGAAHGVGRSAPVARAREQDPCHIAIRIDKRCTRVAELHPRSQLKRCAPVWTPVRTAHRRPDPAADRGAQGGRPAAAADEQVSAVRALASERRRPQAASNTAQGHCHPRRQSSPDRRASHGRPPPRPSSSSG